MVRSSRRRILQYAGASALMAVSSGVRVAYGEQSQPQPRLIVMMLRGAMDGLSLVAPYTEASYYQDRPTIAIARPGEPDGLLPLTDRFGLHPAFMPLFPHWESKQLAFVHASGSPDPTRSHFDAQDYMESATPGRKTTPDGWLNRLAAVVAGPRATPADQRLQALNVGPAMPRIFTGGAAVASLASGSAAMRKTALDRPEIGEAVARVYGGNDRLSQMAREAAATRSDIANALVSDDPRADMGALPMAGLPGDAARLGLLMARDARIRLAFMPVGGWDTHANQGAGKGQLANRFGVLAQSLATLAQALGPRLAETNILVISEFGRTVRQNGTNGTDHGHGNVAMLLGGGVKGGRVLGEWPGLDAAARYEGRDLAITTDFRDLIADVLEERFRLGDAQLARVLPGMERRRRVGLFA